LRAQLRHCKRSSVIASAAPSLQAQLRHCKRSSVIASAAPSLQAQLRHCKRSSVIASAAPSLRAQLRHCERSEAIRASLVLFGNSLCKWMPHSMHYRCLAASHRRHRRFSKRTGLTVWGLYPRGGCFGHHSASWYLEPHDQAPYATAPRTSCTRAAMSLASRDFARHWHHLTPNKRPSQPRWPPGFYMVSIGVLHGLNWADLTRALTKEKLRQLAFALIWPTL
jgi:hypothetical protein